MVKNQQGFTLIEMMIVLLVISVLLIITIPNVTKNNSTINSKGCEAFVRMVEGQVQAYRMDNNGAVPSFAELQGAGYLKEGEASCPNGKAISIDAVNGTVTVAGS
ncbi:competence type IV pilus major pilin ComGC [Bacillus benzoevorans]|uniref:ComG operon protein 3 n=1 Tax=Bacillus benzoevorans TaxID=1456 RepID=A0A7X0HSR6_9BACI|nr:competence type IV pilus major pilin ComGC [Bacillus benzoevorans]MBB6444906.1 competence protein ComGC [Bacillus benzoevorans]